MGTQFPHRFICQPGPHLQPTLSIGNKPVLGLAMGRACEPTLDSINVPAATAIGRMYLVSMIVSSMVDIPEDNIPLAQLNAG
ncbi:hypothetical protein DNR46_20575 [Mesorhizobium japonicum]|uniref:Uncharacterized protein n=1 Tax=Mesorhizobium japonicum TaxID=2066070 RepID=A0A3M9X8F8_9HYPH|nr:hypothetical protein DNR46_20575 [Mesorhizobium japonicum]